MEQGKARIGPRHGAPVARRHGRGGGAQAQAAEDALDWVPAAARDYIAHIEDGRTIRAIAREAQLHPSTISRRVRRVEAQRDDPLVDAAIRNLSSGREPRELAPPAAPKPAPVPAVVKAKASVAAPVPVPAAVPVAVPVPVPAPAPTPAPAPSTVSRLPLASVEQRALPLLRRLSEPGTLLAVAREMENGVVLREGPDGEPQRLAVVARDLAEAMALQEWIGGADPDARIRRYRIAPAGRSLLRRAVAEAARGLAEAPAVFVGPDDVNDPRLRHMRSLLAESPLVTLARRRNGEGQAFLNKDHVAAGERLREDFEAAVQGGAEVPWDEVLRRPGDFADAPPRGRPGHLGGQHRPGAALARVARALEVLGPGLADVALGCCALLEGLEVLERRLGWSSRSGKVVLRIALDRLRRHYQDEEARGGSLIG